MFAMQTGDSEFDPCAPIKVNGYLFVPADRLTVDAAAPTFSHGRSAKTVVEVKRRRVTER